MDRFAWAKAGGSRTDMGGFETRPYMVRANTRVLILLLGHGWGIPALASILPVRASGRPTTLV